MSDHGGTLRALLDGYRRSGRRPDEPPRTWGDVAKECKMSRPHLYRLMRGQCTPDDWRLQRIATVCGTSAMVVEAAFARTLEEAAEGS